MTTTKVGTRQGTVQHGQSPRLLFLVHVEELYEDCFPNGYLNRLDEVCRSPLYQKIIFLNTGWSSSGSVHQRLFKYLRWSQSKMVVPMPQIECWHWRPSSEYQADACMCCKKHLAACPRVVETDQGYYAWTPYELDAASSVFGFNIDVGGGFRGQCLDDWSYILYVRGISHSIRDDLVYELEYWRPQVWQSLTPGVD